MKAAVAEAAGKLAVVEVPVPEPAHGEVLVKVHACGVCHSDHGAIQGHFGSTVKFPFIPGHEIVGTVAKLGPGVTIFKEGALVGGPWHGGHDGTCRFCKRGLFQVCEHQEVNGVTRNGGYAEYCTLRQEACVPLPEDLDPAETAPFLCAGVTVFNGIRQQKIRHGGVVAVVGLGGLGHLAVQYARKMGYRTVAISSTDAKRKFATDLGATDYIYGDNPAEELIKIGGADLIVVTAPNAELIHPLMFGLVPHGKLLILAVSGDVKVPALPMVIRGLTVSGWPSGHAIDSQDAIDFARLQGVHCLVEKFPLEKVNDAMEHMLSGKVRFRSVLTMD